MAWYDEAFVYHIYPLGLTGAPKLNEGGEPVHRLNTLLPWIDHVSDMGGTAIYIGPLFESVGHGYETTDYKMLDRRLGTNEDLTNFVAECHKKGIRVILDGVFNHTGREFFAFKDIKVNRENSRYRDWYCNVNFWGNNEYNDGFSYDNWGGYNLLAKLNQRNPEVKEYIYDVISYWVSEFDIDGIRLDAADVLDFDFMKGLRHVANTVKPEFWLMGEVIHGEYSRWANDYTLHSVTNYTLHKGLYSGHNDHNYFEIAHTVKRLMDMGMCKADGLKLYNFTDNHDVERIYTKLNNKAHFGNVHILSFTLPGIPSVYYGSEFGIEGRKERYSDDSIRPALNLDDFMPAVENKSNSCYEMIKALGHIRKSVKALSYGDYKELALTTRQYAFSRNMGDTFAVITVNNDENPAGMSVDIRRGMPEGCNSLKGLLTGQVVGVENGRFNITLPSCGGEIWVPENLVISDEEVQPIAKAEKPAEKVVEEVKAEKAEPVKAENPEPVKAEQAVVEEATEREAIAAPVEEVKETPVEDAVESDKREFSRIAKEAAHVLSHKAMEIAEAYESFAERMARVVVPENKSYEEMTVPELQAAVLAKLAKNGPVTDRMRKDVEENVYHDSLVNWVKSFR